jgi:acetyl-CoA carboxylase carboxyl transferase subunit alpha
MRVTANELLKLRLIDQIVPEPLGGAHRDLDAAAQNLKKVLADNLLLLEQIPPSELVEKRYERLLAYGKTA